MSQTKVLVVDDSAFMRKVITDILQSDPSIKVIGIAKDGKDALGKLKDCSPDVITLDLDMPVMDGLETLKCIMSTNPRRVLMLSARTQAGARETLDCLEAGAIDFIPKTGGCISLNLKDSTHEIIMKVKSVANARLPDTFSSKSKRILVNTTRSNGSSIAVIGSSTGGPPALERIIPYLPREFPIPILMVQHMPAGFTKSFAERLDRLSAIEVREAKDGDIPKPGLALLAPGGYHMALEKTGNRKSDPIIVRLNTDPPEQGVRPCIDVTIRSVISIYDNSILGVILTGMGRDGTQGIKEIRSLGGVTLAEDPKDCVIDSMPKSAIDSGAIDHIVRISDLASVMTDIAAKLAAKT